MLHAWPRRFRAEPLLSAAALLAALAYWGSHSLYGGLRAASSDLKVHTRRPYLLNGIQLRLDRYVLPTFAPPSRTNGRYLALVSSDECPFSRSEAEVWRSWLHSLPFRSVDAVLFISLSGSKTAAALAPPLDARRVRHSAILVSQVHGFAEETGLAWTPHTLALDGQLRIRVSMERCDSKGYEIVRAFFAESR